MASSVKKTQKSVKAKKKQWFNILAPQSFDSYNLGETTAFEAEQLKGRTIKVNLMSMNNDSRSQHINITFFIDKIVGNNAHTDILRYEIIPSHMKRLVRRNRDRVDHSFYCKTKDDKTAKVKFMIITRFKTTNAVQTQLRKDATNEIVSVFSNNTWENSFREVITSKLQRSMKSRLSKITPLRNVEIKMISLDENKKNRPVITSVDTASHEENVKEKEDSEEPDKNNKAAEGKENKTDSDDSDNEEAHESNKSGKKEHSV